MADDDNNLLIWQFLSVSQQLTSNFLVCHFGYSPSALLFSWFTMSISGPFVLCFDCCCCIMWYQEQHWKAKSQARGETLQSVSHQQSTRFTRRRDLDLGQSTNTPLCSSLFVSLKQSWRLAPKVSHTRHQNLSFSSAPCWPSVTSPFDTCSLVAPVERLTNHLVAAKQSCSPNIIDMCGGGGGGGGRGVGGGGRGGHRKILWRVKTNRAAGFRVRTSVTDPFLLGCVNDTKRSPKVPMKEFRAPVKKSEKETKKGEGAERKIHREGLHLGIISADLWGRHGGGGGGFA